MKTEWKDMDSAPKDRKILACDKYDMCVIWWSDTSVYGHPDWCVASSGGEYNSMEVMDSPKLWTELPENPFDK